MSGYYHTDPTDPEAPVELTEYNGLRPGMRVIYTNPAFQQPDGTYKPAGMDPPLILTALYRMGDSGYTEAIVNGGEWEVNADNLSIDPDA